MAKFKGKELYLADGQRAIFGTDLDSHIWWDDVAQELRLDTTISGVDPVQPYQLTTRWYVDQEIDTLSGTIPYHHDQLIGLADDDHLQYVPRTGIRGFTGTVSGIDPTQPYHLTTKQYVDSQISVLDWQDSVITMSGTAPGAPSTGDRYIITTGTGDWAGHDDEIAEWNGSSWDFTVPNEGFASWVEDVDVIYVYDSTAWVRLGTVVDHGSLTGLADDDHAQYSLVTGTRAFTGTVGGITPTADSHLTTKWYVDQISGSLADHGNLLGLADDDHLQYVPTTGDRGFTGTVSGIDPTQYYHLTTKWYVDNEIDTLSGTIPYEHDQLIGLADDDHFQYVPTNADRGFTATVSGIDPTLDYHLATKWYVDQGNIDRKGKQAIPNGVAQVSVGFADIGDTNYIVNATMANTTDSPPSIYAYIVSATTTSGFTVSFIGDTDSANYVLHWSVLREL
jgi:hypothetical protein